MSLTLIRYHSVFYFSLLFGISELLFKLCSFQSKVKGKYTSNSPIRCYTTCCTTILMSHTIKFDDMTVLSKWKYLSIVKWNKDEINKSNSKVLILLNEMTNWIVDLLG